MIYMNFLFSACQVYNSRAVAANLLVCFKIFIFLLNMLGGIYLISI